jgi:hypothetical protein
MYGAPYSAVPASGGPGAGAPATRPSAMFAAVAALFVTILCCLVETALELLIYQSFGDAVRGVSQTDSTTSSLQPILTTTVGGNALIALGLGAGVALLFRRNNAGRIVIWSAGGVCVLVRICCLSGVGFFGLVNEGIQSEAEKSGNATLTSFAPSWEVWSSVAISSIALIAVVVGMILIGLGPVNRYFRRRPVAPPPGAGYPGPGPGQPYGGWGY